MHSKRIFESRSFKKLFGYVSKIQLLLKKYSLTTFSFFYLSSFQFSLQIFVPDSNHSFATIFKKQIHFHEFSIFQIFRMTNVYNSANVESVWLRLASLNSQPKKLKLGCVTRSNIFALSVIFRILASIAPHIFFFRKPLLDGSEAVI